MDVTPLVRQGQQIIQSYANGVFRISGSLYEEAVFVSPDQTEIWTDAPADFSDLTLSHFDVLIARADDIDVVLLGCGAEIAFLPREIKQALSEAGLPVDVMDTGAACRTYNVLMAEGRRVVAALMPI